jgi:DNA-binding LytR/AlgR family response regulator
MMRNKFEFDILEFVTENKKLKELIKQKENNHIYILDFQLPNSNAIEIARLIRQEDWESPIIIFSAHGGMAYETFKQRLQILDFVNKQFEVEKNLFELFDICLKQLGMSPALKFKISGVDYNITFDRILYIYRDTFERKAIVVTNNTQYKINLNINEIYEKLDSRFKISHKACIVNMDKVEAINWKENKITFCNGHETYLLSKTRKKEFEVV